MRKIEAAKHYAAKGWRLLPLMRGGKIPVIADWTEKASNDPTFIEQMWGIEDNNLGLLTGADSGIFVVDLDQKPGINGLDSLKKCFGDQFDFDPEKYLVGMTPSGGLHLYFAWPDDGTEAKTCAGILPGVDVRGTGGQVVLPPSCVIRKGRKKFYSWKNEQLPPAPMLPWAHMLLSMSGKRASKGELDLPKVVEGLREGNRDEQIYKYACHLRYRGIDYGLALGFVLAAAERAYPPFDADQAKAKVDRAFKGAC